MAQVIAGRLPVPGLWGWRRGRVARYIDSGSGDGGVPLFKKNESQLTNDAKLPSTIP